MTDKQNSLFPEIVPDEVVTDLDDELVPSNHVFVITDVLAWSPKSDRHTLEHPFFPFLPSVTPVFVSTKAPMVRQK